MVAVNLEISSEIVDRKKEKKSYLITKLTLTRYCRFRLSLCSFVC